MKPQPVESENHGQMVFVRLHHDGPLAGMVEFFCPKCGKRVAHDIEARTRKIIVEGNFYAIHGLSYDSWNQARIGFSDPEFNRETAEDTRAIEEWQEWLEHIGFDNWWTL